MPSAPVEILPYEAFHQPLSPLFRDYLAGRPSVVAFFGAAGFDPAAMVGAAARADTLARPRAALADALVRQQTARGASRAAERAGTLREPGSVAVVTGQQAGLFGGPLFVLFKALATVQVARLLTERGRPAVPVFWVASDDHDFAEIRSVSVIDKTGGIRTMRYAPRREPVGEPAWRIVLDETITALVDELAAALPRNLGGDEVLGLVAECYRPGETLAGAFARFVSRLLPELVVLEPADRALKALAAPVLVREVREASPTSRLAIEAGKALLAAGYHQQVPVRPGFLNMFALVQGQRRALALVEGQVEVRGTRQRLPLDEVVREIEAEPERWSAGALLRPLVQDALLPTAAYVGGPAEIAYHAQIGPSYAHFGIPRPALLPRPSLTLVEPTHARSLSAEGLTLVDLEADPEALVGRWAREAYPGVEAAFASTREAVEREMGAVEEALAAADPTLRAAAAAARGRALHQVEGLHEKALRALKKRDQGRADRLRRTRDALFPGGAFQERGVGLICPLAERGLALTDELEARLDPFARGHQVVRL